MPDLFQGGILSALAEMTATRNGCGDVAAEGYVIHTGGGDGSMKRKFICSKPQYHSLPWEKAGGTNVFVLSQLCFP